MDTGKKFLALQFRTDQSLTHEQDCLLRSGGFKKSELQFLNVLDQQNKLPKIKDLNNYQGIILGGSGEINISDWSEENKAKILKIGPFLKKVIDSDIPM